MTFFLGKKKRHLGGGLFSFFFGLFLLVCPTPNTHTKKRVREESRDVLKVLKAHHPKKQHAQKKQRSSLCFVICHIVVFVVALLCRKDTLIEESRLMRDDASTNTIFVTLQKNVATTQDDDALSETQKQTKTRLRRRFFVAGGGRAFGGVSFPSSSRVLFDGVSRKQRKGRRRGVDRRHRAARWPIRFLPSRRADVRRPARRRGRRSTARTTTTTTTTATTTTTT